MRIASTAASATSFERVMRPVGQPESFWMEHLNSRLLSAAFETSFESGEILSMANSVWTKGRELQDARLLAVPGFSDPKPDTAFGIGFQDRSVAGNPFCAPTLDRLQGAFPDFVLSPDGRETLRTLMPGFIYEAKPDLKRPDVVKAQIALGAHRGEVRLQRLKQLSRTVSSSPIVVCATSAAHTWTFYLATVTVSGNHMDTDLYAIGRPLDISKLCKKVHLHLVFNRIHYWLLATHRGGVHRSLTAMVRLLKQPHGAAGLLDIIRAEVEEENADVEDGERNAEGAEGRQGLV